MGRTGAGRAGSFAGLIQDNTPFIMAGHISLPQITGDDTPSSVLPSRSQITCGTHALTIALSSILRPGDELLSPVGKPYDTLEGIIGIEGTDTKGSLREFGVSYRQVDLVGDSEFDYAGIKNALNEKTKISHDSAFQRIRNAQNLVC